MGGGSVGVSGGDRGADDGSGAAAPGHVHAAVCRLGGACGRADGGGGAGNRAVRNDWAEGKVDVVVETQAIGSAGVRALRLGLVVIDEEQGWE